MTYLLFIAQLVNGRSNRETWNLFHYGYIGLNKVDLDWINEVAEY